MFFVGKPCSLKFSITGGEYLFIEKLQIALNASFFKSTGKLKYLVHQLLLLKPLGARRGGASFLHQSR